MEPNKQHIAAILTSLSCGPLQAIGGSIFDNCGFALRITTTDLQVALDYINRCCAANDSAIRIGRIDAGGSPKWDFCHSNSF